MPAPPKNRSKSAACPARLKFPSPQKNSPPTGRCDAIICIGCVLRGETSHYDYVAGETSRGIQLAQLDTGVPMMFCVLTCDTLEQAIDRAGLKGGNKGFEAGLGAIEMATPFAQACAGCVPPAARGAAAR